MGKLFVIEGLDGSGKATQARLLAAALQAEGLQVKQVTFPNYQSPSSSLIKMYLGGELGQSVNDVNAYAASAFYAVDRFASFKKEWEKFYTDGGIIIADRYTTSNAVHQCSKLLPTQWQLYLDWLFDFEYNKMCIPAPDGVIYLDMNPEISQKLICGRYNGDNEKKDIHEKDLTYLKNSRKAAEFCVQALGWHKILCDNGIEPYSIDKISKDVYLTIKDIL